MGYSSWGCKDEGLSTVTQSCDWQSVLTISWGLIEVPAHQSSVYLEYLTAWWLGCVESIPRDGKQKLLGQHYLYHILFAKAVIGNSKRLQNRNRLLMEEMVGAYFRRACEMGDIIRDLQKLQFIIIVFKKCHIPNAGVGTGQLDQIQCSAFFVNKVLLKHRHAHTFTCHLWELSHHNS